MIRLRLYAGAILWPTRTLALRFVEIREQIAHGRAALSCTAQWLLLGFFIAIFSQ